jgi:hypothetical protein
MTYALRQEYASLSLHDKNSLRCPTPNIHSHAHPERLTARRAEALHSAADEDAERDARAASGEMDSVPGQGAIELDQPASDFVVGADVSLPLELPTGHALAGQLRGLNQLMVHGVLTEEE